MSDEPTLDLPRLLDDRYRLDGLAGAGGMGRVHRAWDTRLGRRVAIKMLAPELAADADVSARLRAEGRHLASIAHPNLVALYDVSADGVTPYLVMELVDGESLAERLRRDGPLPTREVAAIVTGIAAGLSALHGAGIVHRDVSPANVLLGRDGRPRLADLGLAHELDRPAPIPAGGMVHGTLRYLAPELLDRVPATPASDVYALAAVTYAALLGRPPAVATDVIRLRAAYREPPIRPSLLRAGLDPAVDDVLLRALGPAPARPTAYAFAVAIANALRASDDPTTHPAGSGLPPAGPVGVADRSPRRQGPGRSTRRMVAALGAGMLVLTLAGAGLATIDHALERPANPALVAGLTAPSDDPLTSSVQAERPEVHPVAAGGPGDRLAGSLTGTVARRVATGSAAGTAAPPAPAATPPRTPRRLTVSRDTQLAIAGSVARDHAMASATVADRGGGADLMAGAHGPAGATSGSVASTSDAAARGDGDRTARTERVGSTSTVLRSDRSSRDDDDRKDRSGKDREHEGRSNGREDRSGKD